MRFPSMGRRLLPILVTAWTAFVAWNWRQFSPLVPEAVIPVERTTGFLITPEGDALILPELEKGRLARPLEIIDSSRGEVVRWIGAAGDKLLSVSWFAASVALLRGDQIAVYDTSDSRTLLRMKSEAADETVLLSSNNRWVALDMPPRLTIRELPTGQVWSSHEFRPDDFPPLSISRPDIAAPGRTIGVRPTRFVGNDLIEVNIRVEIPSTSVRPAFRDWWNVQTGERDGRFHDLQVDSLSPDGQLALMSEHGGGGLHVCELATGRRLWSLPRLHGLLFSADSSSLMFFTRSVKDDNADGPLRVICWDARRGPTTTEEAEEVAASHVRMWGGTDGRISRNGRLAVERKSSRPLAMPEFVVRLARRLGANWDGRLGASQTVYEMTEQPSGRFVGRIPLNDPVISWSIGRGLILRSPDTMWFYSLSPRRNWRALAIALLAPAATMFAAKRGWRRLRKKRAAVEDRNTVAV